MPFERGTFSFSAFELREDPPEDLVEIFAARHAGKLDEVTADPQVGWVTGRHLLDTAIDGASAQRGGCYYLTLRQAVRKIPASLLNALCRREEYAYMKANELDYVSGKIRRQIKEETVEKNILKMPPSLSGIPMVLEPHSRRLYLSATSQTQIDLFVEQFYQALKLEPVQITPAYWLEKNFKTTPASLPPLDATDARKGADPTPGRDLLLYLWYLAENEIPIKTRDFGSFDMMIEAPLNFAGDGEDTGAAEATIKKGNSPLRSAEAKAALEIGKKLKKAKLTLTRENQIWSGTFDADRFVFGSFSLPEGEEMNPDEIFSERIDNLGIFLTALEAAFGMFASAMLEGKAAETRRIIADWVARRDAV